MKNQFWMLVKTVVRSLGPVGLLLAMVVLLVPGRTMIAQGTSATVRGVVTDSTGATIKGANISLRNQDSGVEVFTGQSQDDGIYLVPNVPPGTYELTISADGMKTATLSGIVATASSTVTNNVSLLVGNAQETVNVSVEAITLQRDSSEVSTVLYPQDIADMPLALRATENLMALMPGVSAGGGGSTVTTSQLSINGSRTLNTEVLLNGVSIIIGNTGNILTLPSPDGVEQLKLLSATAPAEFGRTSGAVLTSTTRGGTNHYHGTVYSLTRNEAFNANTYFNKTSGLPRGKQRYFQYGAAFGGPVPHFHDRLFFFFNWDHLLNVTTSKLTLTVPNDDWRKGNFSTSPQTVYLPGSTTSAAYPKNTLTNIDPAAAKIMALLPEPNVTGDYDSNNNRYINNRVDQSTLRVTTDKIVGRVDAQITPKGRLIANVYRYKNASPQPVYFNSPLLNQLYDCNCENAWVGSLNYSHIVSSTLFLDATMGYFRDQVQRNPPGTDNNINATTGISSLPLNRMPTIALQGFFTMIGATTNVIQNNINNTFAPSGNVTKLVGRHSLKIGTSVRWNQFNAYNPTLYPQGYFAFTGDVTNHGSTGNATTTMADFLTGSVKTAQYTVPQPLLGRRAFAIGLYVMDDWKPLRNLTINAGLRYEYENPVSVANGRYTRFDSDTGNLLIAGVNSTSSTNIVLPKTDFAPRIGLAYSVGQNTVIHSAFGTFYGVVFQNLGGTISFPGYEVTKSFSSIGTAKAQPFSLSNGIPLTAVRDLNNPQIAVNAATTSSPYTATTAYGNLKSMPETIQWSLGVQRQWPMGIMTDFNYVGNHGVHLPTNFTTNAVPLSQTEAVLLANTTVARQLARPFPLLTSWPALLNIGDSSYHGLQIMANKQVSHGLSIIANYTFSKALDDGSTIYDYSAPNGTANAQYAGDASMIHRDWALSSISQKHSVNIAIRYVSPSRGNVLLRNWTVSPVFYARSGLPINITQTNMVPDAGYQRPNGNLKALRNPNPKTTSSALQWLKTTNDPTFPLTPSGPIYSTVNGVRTEILNTFFGNTGRNTLLAPGSQNLNVSIMRNFPIYSKVRFEFRVDGFNVLNRANFRNPSTGLTVVTSGTTASFSTGTSFGQITNTYNARELQLVGRISF